VLGVFGLLYTNRFRDAALLEKSLEVKIIKTIRNCASNMSNKSYSKLGINTSIRAGYKLLKQRLYFYNAESALVLLFSFAPPFLLYVHIFFRAVIHK